MSTKMGKKNKLLIRRGARAYVHIGAVSMLVLVIVGYVFFQTRNVMRGPIITIHTPENGATLGESLVTIKGVAASKKKSPKTKKMTAQTPWIASLFKWLNVENSRNLPLFFFFRAMS